MKITTLFKFFKSIERWLLKQCEPPPEYKLVPDGYGKYTLERWHPDVKIYLCEEVSVDKEQAERIIKNLSRESIPYIEDNND